MLNNEQIKKEVDKMNDENCLKSRFCHIEIHDITEITPDKFNRNRKMNDDNSIYITDYRYGLKSQIDKEKNILLFPNEKTIFYYPIILKRNIIYRFISPENQVKFFYNSEARLYGNGKSLEEVKKECVATSEGNKVDLKLDFSTIPIGYENKKLLTIINENQNHIYVKFGQKINVVRIFSIGPVTLLDQENGKRIELHNLIDYYAIDNDDHKGLILINE